ncbi:MAG TPA: response regulator [Planctomycetota bacterium]|nr:response regulator [Planctomycetota bacterium]
MVSAVATTRRGSDPLVVCVDDDPQVLRAMQRLLRREPYELLTTDKPSTALRWVKERKVELLITDLQMPEMNGIELIKVVEERSPQTSSLILTGFPERLPGSEGLGESAPRLIAKPWSDVELKGAIRELVPLETLRGTVPTLDPSPPWPRAQLLVVETDPQFRLLASTALTREGFDLHLAGSPGEAMQVLRAERACMEIAILGLGTVSGALVELIRVMRRVCPGLYILVMAEHASRVEIRSWYEAGAADVFRRSITSERLANYLKCSVFPARESRRAAEKLAEELRRRASESRHQRIFRLLGSYLHAPTSSRKGERRTLAALGITSLLIGIFLARNLDKGFVRLLPAEPRMESLEELGNRLRRQSQEDQVLRSWYMMQQLDLGREMNEQTRRYQEEQLKERRREAGRPHRTDEMSR